jgi:hypothetical protein
MNNFDRLVISLLEDNAAGAGGVFGNAPSMNHGGDVGNSDFYAPGTAVIPYAIGAKIVKGKGKKGKRKLKIPIQKRTFTYF